MKYTLFSLCLMLLCISCAKELNQTSNMADAHSLSNFESVLTTHMNLELKIHFDSRHLSGKVSYDLAEHESTKLILDTKDLEIHKCTLGTDEIQTDYSISDEVDFLGNALSIDIKKDTRKVTIYYSTKPDGAAAIDWLSPQQTANKKHPFMFTQGQAILTRTWIPCQDSPGVRMTYDARIQAPKDIMVVMSAENPTEKSDSGIYDFKMEQEIPPYLIALAAGDLAFKEIGAHTGIYAQPNVLDEAVEEFKDLENMLVSAEALYGKYLWDRYDVLVLPPSFPFGGMENPRLTFATPTIIAGDGSLTALLAHELAHSWSGNLVTNANWNDFWLNEGFTVYFERRIMEALYGKDYAEMLAVLGYQDLTKTIVELGHDHPDTHLKLHLDGRDADDGMTDVAYEKGALFLTALENKVGRKEFDKFLNAYFTTYKFKNITTESFLSYLDVNLISPKNVDIDVDAWVYSPGIPPSAPIPTSTLFDEVDNSLHNFLEKGKPTNSLKTDAWSTHEWLHFIRHLPKDLGNDQARSLESAFAFAASGNSEILAAWFEQSIINGHIENIKEPLEAFLIKVGRRKFLMPLYKALKENGNIALAKDIYAKARSNYHSVSFNSIDKLLE